MFKKGKTDLLEIKSIHELPGRIRFHCEALYYIREFNEEILNSLLSTNMIKKASINNITKNKFIKMVNDIKNENYGSLKTVQLIKDLTDIFLYLNDDINVYSIDTIKCILFYKNVNNVSSKEATNVFKEIVYVK